MRTPPLPPRSDLLLIYNAGAVIMSFQDRILPAAAMVLTQYFQSDYHVTPVLLT